jgi:hypothetical protein
VTRRALVLLVLLAVGTGCARRPTPGGDGSADPFARARPAAAALVFEPAVSRDFDPQSLARDDRQPQAFVGYPEGQAEYFYLRWDDRQSNWGHGHHGGDDHYERRAVSEKVGVLYR